MQRRGKTEFNVEIRTMGLLGFILIVASLWMFGNLAAHDWADTRRLVLAFIFMGAGIIMVVIDQVLERRRER